MAKSLFHKDQPEQPSPPTPYQLIEPEIVHLQKAGSVRHGNKAGPKTPPWLVMLAFLVLGWLYLIDPPMHAWYKGDAIRDYLYLHNYGGGAITTALINSQILAPDEIDTLNHRSGSFQDYFRSPDAADRQANEIITYMDNVRRLHEGRYENLNPIGRMRYFLFIYTGLVLPTKWEFLDPTVSN